VSNQGTQDNSLQVRKDAYELVVAELLSGKMTRKGTNDLVQIRIRDAVLRFAFDNPELRETMANTLGKLIDDTSIGNVRVTATTLKAGILWLDGKQDETIALVNSALQIKSDYSLAQLLDVALRHNVPSSVWAQSLENVSLDACLMGTDS
jgi:hypothetical protein